MLIRSTEDACFVMLRNGLTLEVVYDRAHAGMLSVRPTDDIAEPSDLPAPSCGVWLLGETVIVEVQAGLA